VVYTAGLFFGYGFIISAPFKTRPFLCSLSISCCFVYHFEFVLRNDELIPVVERGIGVGGNFKCGVRPIATAVATSGPGDVDVCI